MNERLFDTLVAGFADGHRRRGQGFYLDFAAIPHRGQEAELDQHRMPMRNRGKPSVMAFMAQEAQRRIVCYATANVVRKEAVTVPARFVHHWKERTGPVLFGARFGL